MSQKNSMNGHEEMSPHQRAKAEEAAIAANLLAIRHLTEKIEAIDYVMKQNMSRDELLEEIAACQEMADTTDEFQARWHLWWIEVYKAVLAK